MRSCQPPVIVAFFWVLSGAAVAGEPALRVPADQPVVTVGRDLYVLLGHVEPVHLQATGPGTLRLRVRVNLAPQAASSGPVELRLLRLDGEERPEVARWTFEEPRDQARVYAETDRYRPSFERRLEAQLPEGPARYWVELAPGGARLGVAMAFELLAAPGGPATEDAADLAAAEAAPGAAGPAGPPPRRGLVAHGGAAFPLVAAGGVAGIVGLGLLQPLGSGAWRLRLAGEAWVHELTGSSPAAAGFGQAAEAAVGYDAAALLLGVERRWRPAGFQPFVGAAAGVTTAREHVRALRGGVDAEQTLLLLAAEARAGLEWSPAPEVGPLSLSLRALLHPALLRGAPLARPVPASNAALEVGYHVPF